MLIPQHVECLLGLLFVGIDQRPLLAVEVVPVRVQVVVFERHERPAFDRAARAVGEHLVGRILRIFPVLESDLSDRVHGTYFPLQKWSFLLGFQSKTELFPKRRKTVIFGFSRSGKIQVFPLD